MTFELPSLPYSYDALEPHIDARTMEIHHTRHHQAYIDKVNAALKGTAFEGHGIEDLLGGLADIPESIRAVVQNHGGGHANHSLFWTVIGPQGGGSPRGRLAAAIDSDIGGFEKFRQEFTAAALNRFGSGWAWLNIGRDHRLAVESGANQDSPLAWGKIPLLGLDVWEHAYYLKYQNRRADYVAAFFNLINWEEVLRRFEQAG